jgi:hypothetical protein
LNISENGEKGSLYEFKGLYFRSYTCNGEEIIKAEGEILPIRHDFVSVISIYNFKKEADTEMRRTMGSGQSFISDNFIIPRNPQNVR